MDKLRRILVGVDFDVDAEDLTLGSRTAARRALWLAGRTGARVDFLHANGDGPESGRALTGELPSWASSVVDGLLVEHGEGVESSGLELSSERSWVALVRRVVAGDAHLVVVAKRNRDRRDDRRLGSVSMKLVRLCPAPVWVVKPEHELHHRCVLAATDLSPVGDRAVEYGAFMAEADQTALHVVHAWQRPMELQMVSDAERRDGERAIVDAALTHLRALPGVAALGDKAHLFLGCDTPSHAILGVVEKEDPDLVVMGTVSRGGLAGLIVGNTAERLLYKLDCSILAVKPDDFGSPLEAGGLG